MGPFKFVDVLLSSVPSRLLIGHQLHCLCKRLWSSLCWLDSVNCQFLIKSWSWLLNIHHSSQFEFHFEKLSHVMPLARAKSKSVPNFEPLSRAELKKSYGRAAGEHGSPCAWTWTIFSLALLLSCSHSNLRLGWRHWSLQLPLLLVPPKDDTVRRPAAQCKDWTLSHM